MDKLLKLESEAKQLEKQYNKGNQELKQLEQVGKEAEQLAQPKKLIPIFIGTELGDIVGLIDAIVKEKFDDHTLVVLAPKLYGQMAYKYELEKMEANQKQAIIDAQKNVKMKADALDVAQRISATLDLPFSFTAAELKLAYNARGHKVSHKQVDEIVGFLGIYGYLRQVDVDVPSHKMRYNLVFSEQETIDQLETKTSVIKLKIAQLTQEMNGNEAEVKALKTKADTDSFTVGNDQSIDDSKPIKKVAAAPKRKKADAPNLSSQK